MAAITQNAREAGLPEIAIDAVVGRLLKMLTAMTRGRLVIEVGTLGGYSAAWLEQGLADDGRLITIEIDPVHAAFAQREFERLGIADRIELREGDAAHVLAGMAEQLSPGSVDVVFLDADKQQYPRYWELVKPMIAEGGLIILDNALGSGQWWVGDDHPDRHAADRACRAIASDPDFDAVAFPLRQGVLVGRRIRIGR